MRSARLLAASLLLFPAVAIAADQPQAVLASEAAAPPASEKMICLAQIETGSLVKKTKRCYTKKQWKYVNDKSQEHMDRLQLDNATRQSGEGSTFSGG